MAVPRIAKEDLKQRLESPDAAARPLIIDVRLKYPYEHSSLRLPGALRVAPTGDAWLALPRDREIVAYDSDPDELVSSRVAADLIRHGYRAFALKGGIADWIGANYPVEAREGTGGVAAPPSKD
jgi:rhodanese-related sulfurtransferase